MSTRISGRTAAAHQNDHPAVNAKRDRKKDRSSLCTYTFADGRRCRSPRHSSTSSFCFFHARKEAQARAAEDLGHDISYFFSGHYLSACDLSIALGRVFAATAQGQIKRKTAATLAFLGQVLVQSIRIAEHEYCTGLVEASPGITKKPPTAGAKWTLNSFIINTYKKAWEGTVGQKATTHLPPASH